MAALRILLAVAALGAHAHSATLTTRQEDVTLSLEPQLTGGFSLTIIKDDETIFHGSIGRTVMSTYVSSQEIEGGMQLSLPGAELSVHTVVDEAAGARGVKIVWDANEQTRLEDCFDFGTKHWYGGPMELIQTYPIEKSTQVYAPYYTREGDNGAIMERYWLNSAGEYIYVHPQVPLFIDYNNITSNHMCFGAQIAAPYSTKRNHTELSYDLWFLSDVKAAHKHALKNYLGWPSGTPDFRMIQHPIWSTWAQFARDIDETNLMEYAEEINSRGFANAQLEIDDLWEICYGSLTVDVKKFSDMKKFVQDIKAMGYRATIWIHPFINQNCEPWYSDALAAGYLVLNEDGSPDTSWWNNNGSVAAYIDFTNPTAAEWWYQRVKLIVDTYDIDSLKFDAGEASWSPEVAVQTGDVDLHPHHITQAYVRTCARFGNMIEVRTGFQTQTLPIFVRMVDRDSIWGLTNGLSTVITTTLQMNLNGYTMVLPDMIGGNGYNLDNPDSGLPTKQLFIRWVQANTFLPAMQFSFVPWGFDNETSEISLKYTKLHAEYATHIQAAMNASVLDGRPVNGPLWWIAPNDAQALTIWDQYLLGEDIIVAPILVENATSRDIYLPEGEWLEKGDESIVHTGPLWIRGHSVPIDDLAFFVRKTEPDAASHSQVSAILLALVLIIGLLYH
ncbi:myogenesis-regulating glycosidase-like [Cydia splendana]|uniref:myogenesis-regulating glycosidase-like n=1 Tax=Cydia splendana TaxID=1100963 RepID=UPI0028F4725C